MLPPRPPSPAQLASGILRLIAPNPSPMTYWGTNTFLIGSKDVAVIDPGPADEGHLAAIIAALPTDAHVSHILVTHAHLDHSPGARALADSTGAPVLAFGNAADGRSEVMQHLAARGLAGGGEGVDEAFAPDVRLQDGETVSGSDWSLAALHTPGHMGNHLSFGLGDILFCGDLVMGWSSSLVSPPDGDLTDFMASCEKLRQKSWRTFYPAHGDPIERPLDRLDWLLKHRHGREKQILAALEDGPATARHLAKRIYTDTPANLLPAATRNVLAHLIDLTARALVKPEGSLSQEATFGLSET